MARSLNKVILIGNLTRDPELRYTPQGTAVCTIGVATNRQWTTESGEKKEDVEFHRLVAWNKLAEICANLLKKGRKVYVEGRLQTRSWQGQDGAQRTTTEIILSDMLLLDSRREGDTAAAGEFDIPEEQVTETPAPSAAEEPDKGETSKKKGKAETSASDEAPADKSTGEEDIPF